MKEKYKNNPTTLEQIEGYNPDGRTSLNRTLAAMNKAAGDNAAIQ